MLRSSTAVAVLACAGAAVNGALFWNIPVLFAAGLQFRLSRLIVGITILQIALLLVLVPLFDAIGGALTFLIIQIVVNGISTILALRVLRGTISVQA